MSGEQRAQIVLGIAQAGGLKPSGVFELLKEKSALIDQGLKQFLPQVGGASSKEVREYYEMIWDYNLRGGKRLRPTLCLLSAQMFGGSEEKALPTAVAIEVLQNFLLVHDDIQDESELRRGKPCLHKLYGVGPAINAGDGLLVKVFEILNSNKRLLGAGKTLKIMQEFVRQLNYTVEGQAMELSWIKNSRWDLSEQDYLKLVELKTAHYTITTPLRLGAIIAGASAKEINSFDKIGLKLGTAFQIQDDVLNLVGEEGKYGKEIAGDLLEGKRTLLLIHLLKKCSEEEKKFVVAALGKPRQQKTLEEARQVVEMMREKGSIEYCAGKAKKMAEEALLLFDKKFAHLEQSDAKKQVRELMEFVANRKY